MTRTFYRVGNLETNAGLWYDMEGNFTGLIHDRFAFCKNSTLPMPFDENVRGYLSAVETLDELWAWFTQEDVERLAEYGYRVQEYRSADYKLHNGHWLISQTDSVLQRILLMEGLSAIAPETRREPGYLTSKAVAQKAK